MKRIATPAKSMPIKNRMQSVSQPMKPGPAPKKGIGRLANLGDYAHPKKKGK